MSKKLQITTSDKNYRAILEVKESGELLDYEGNSIKSDSSIGSFFLDLGVRVYFSSKENKKEKEKEFDENGFNREIYKGILQNVQLSKAVINILNQLEPFKNRKLIDEEFNNNEISRDWIIEKLRCFFDEDNNKK